MVINAFGWLEKDTAKKTNMRIEDFGYNTLFEQFRMNHHLEGFEIGRVIAAHKDRYIVKTSYDEYEAEIMGHMRFTTKSHEDFPAVGDWVALIVSDPDFAIIHTLLPRFSILKRQAVGQSGGIQVIAANIDFAFLVQAVDRDFNIKEVGITDSTNGLEITFNPIVGFAQDCKFKDCTHLNQIGCAVLEAVEKGEIDRTSYENYLKMEREKTHFESTVEERRKRDREFGKMVKNYKKGK